MSPKSGNGLFPGKKAPAAIPTARKMLKIRKKHIFYNLDMSPNPGTAFFSEIKNACGNTHSESNAQKYTTGKHVDKYTNTFGQIHKNIWKHTREHLETYTNTFGNIHKHIWRHTYKHLDTYTNTFGNIHKNMGRHTYKHLDKYTRTFGQIHKNIWTNTHKHLDAYTKTG